MMTTQYTDNICANLLLRNVPKVKKTSDMFPLRENIHHIRHPEKYVVFPANTKRLANSAILYLQRLLNSN